MVSFVCEACQETLKKQKLDQHKQRCWHAQFTCVDCSKTFQGTEYRAHTSCISETEKYHKTVYKPTKKELQQKQKQQEQQEKTAAAIAKSDAPANIAAVPKSAPLMAQISGKTAEKRSNDDDEDAEDAEEEKVEKKSKKAKAEEDDEDINFSKSIKAVLKKNNHLSLSNLRKKVVAKLTKKKDGVTKESLAAKFDAAIVVGLGDDGTITIQ